MLICLAPHAAARHSIGATSSRRISPRLSESGRSSAQRQPVGVYMPSRGRLLKRAVASGDAQAAPRRHAVLACFSRAFRRLQLPGQSPMIAAARSSDDYSHACLLTFTEASRAAPMRGRVLMPPLSRQLVAIDALRHWSCRSWHGAMPAAHGEASQAMICRFCQVAPDAALADHMPALAILS